MRFYQGEKKRDDYDDLRVLFMISFILITVDYDDLTPQNYDFKMIYHHFPQEQMAVLWSQWTQAALIELVNWDITCDTSRVECKHCLGSFLWLVGCCHDNMI